MTELPKMVLISDKKVAECHTKYQVRHAQREADLIIYQQALDKIAELKAENAELNFVFDITDKANRQAISLWSEAHPENKMIIPDQTKMVEWLLEQLDKLKAERDTAIKAVEEVFDDFDAEIFRLSHVSFSFGRIYEDNYNKIKAKYLKPVQKGGNR